MKKLAIFSLTLLVIFFTVLLARAQTVKFEETFNVDPPPTGWLVVNNDGSPDVMHENHTSTVWHYVTRLTFNPSGLTVLPQAGQYLWYSSFQHANSSGVLDEWLITPQITGIETGDSLCFFAGATDDGFNDSLRVFVSTTGNTIGDFTNQIAYFKLDGPIGAYHKHTFDLSPFAGNDIFIAVNYFVIDGGPSGNQSDNVWVDHFSVFNATLTSIDEEAALPDKFALEQNYPNPFNPSTKIAFALPRRAEVTLKVFNILGQEVAAPLIKKQYPAGRHTFTFDGAGIPNGIYYYKLEAGSFSQIRKMTLLK